LREEKEGDFLAQTLRKVREEKLVFLAQTPRMLGEEE
jgi:hypothetical protein